MLTTPTKRINKLDKQEKGYVDVDFFNYTFSGPKKAKE